MLIKRPEEIRPSEITDESVYRGRRRFLAAVAAGVGGVALGGGYLASLQGQGRDANAAEGTPSPGRYAGLPKGPFSTTETPTDYAKATSYNNFYELGTDKRSPAQNAHLLITSPWSVTVEGECNRPGNYHLEDLLRPLPLEDRIYRLRCVEAWSAVIPWVGFALGDLLKRFEPNAHAKYVEFLAINDPERLPGQATDIIEWPYREGLRMDEAMHPLATIAVGMYGRELPNQNGAPLRLVLPWKYGFKGIKSIVAIRFVRQDPIGSWQALQPTEYGFYANVNPAVDHPRWSQATERRLGEWRRRDTLPFNGYAEQVAHLYRGMDLSRYF